MLGSNKISDLDTVPAEVLARYFPLNSLHINELNLLAEGTTIIRARKGRVLVELGDSDQKALYLLSGKLCLTPADDHSHIIEAGSEEARRPISHLDPHQYTVTCLTYVEFFRIGNQVIDNLLGENYGGAQVSDMNFSDQALSSPLFREIYEDLQGDRLEIPTLPRIAIQVQEAIEQGANIRELELMLQCDLVLAGHILRVANSPLYHQKDPIATMEQAILRLGMTMVRNIVINYAMSHYYKSPYEQINQLMKFAWTHSAEVGALSYVLSRELTLFDPEQALLMGLLHDIGMIPVLMYAERHEELLNDREHLELILRELHGDVGAAILAQWDFPEEFMVVARESDDWFRDSNPGPDYCDLVLVAQLHSFIGQNPHKIKALTGGSCAALEKVPAFKKLGLDAFSPHHGVELIAEANHYLNPMKKILHIKPKH